MDFTGSYEMTKSDNFEEYLKEIGVGLATRKLAAASKPTEDIRANGDDWRMKTTTTLKTIELVFTLGQEFTEETADGRKCQTVFTVNGNVLTQVQKLEGMTCTITRTFTEDGLTAVFQAGHVVSTRVYRRAAA
ncbi:lipocalin/fatty-acid binding family protein [Streptomyces sp. NPDC003952]